MVLFALFSRNMEWTDAHDIQPARGVLVSEPFRFKPRTVERGKVWQEIANRLNENRLIHFRVTKCSTREHFSLLLEKFKAKRKIEAKQSGVDVQDSELDVAMEEIWEKWQEAESQDATYDMNKKQIEADKASGEEVRRKACEKLGEPQREKWKKKLLKSNPESQGGMVAIPLNFFVKKRSRTLQLGKKRYNAKKEKKSVMVDYKSNFYLPSNSSNNIKCKC